MTEDLHECMTGVDLLDRGVQMAGLCPLLDEEGLGSFGDHCRHKHRKWYGDQRHEREDG